MSGRLGQLWVRHHGFDPLYMQKPHETLYYVVASSKNHYHMIDLDDGSFVSFKKSKFDKARDERPTWFTKTQDWKTYWERVA